MAPRRRRLSGSDVVAALRTLGFEVVSTNGSHAKLRRTTGGGEKQILTIPLHKELAPGTVHAIYPQAARFVPREDLFSHTGRPEPRTSRGMKPQPTKTAARDARSGR